MHLAQQVLSIGKYLGCVGGKLSSCEIPVEFSIALFCMHDMNRKLSSSLDAFKGRIMTSNLVLKQKKVSVSFWAAMWFS